MTSVALGAATATALLVAACYDVDALRGGVRPGTALDAGPFDVAAPRVPGFCEQQDGAAFCDDFDQPDDVPLEARWTGFAPIVPGVLLVGDASVSRGPGTIEPLSPPSVLRIQADSDAGVRVVGMVVTITPELGPEARALELTADLHGPELLSYLDRGIDPKVEEAGVEDPRAPFVSVAGLGTSVIDPIGATLVLSPGGLALGSGLQAEETVSTARQLVARYEYAQVLRFGWLRVVLVAGERETVMAHVGRELGVEPTCPSTSAVAAAWASVPVKRVGCIPVDARFLPLAGKPAGIVLGGSYRDAARVRLELDNVVLRVLR